ncbi:hypothetical protein Q4Q34_01400 [Flavivirga abyssicola]|uniref:hypothetical protein n=1 Tax=Flavivirga abyssicola TaxID=3063533 RepID=UPI0026DF76B9|nr:hypothetical protein [Flavivirga sp. MEBiC07777]WVK13694.1 hypothetical protein Q4Q34_01400 [Flavivirga sp. MEBiC07777]
MKKICPLFIIIALIVLSSCKDTEKEKNTIPVEKIESDISNNNKSPDVQTRDTNRFIISEDGFMGFKIGGEIDSKSKYLKKSVQKNGEGSFNGYILLNDNGDEIGFIFPKYDNKKIINMIEISSSKYKTKEGISIGSTYQDLKNHYPNIETHGSEIESRTTSKTGNLSFLLDIAFNTYEIDESKIKPLTKIKKITISN